MASSRESSPSSASSQTSPLQLTPNSKVKALTAQFDNDSDEESDLESARARLKASLAKKSPLKPAELRSAGQDGGNLASEDSRNASEEEDEDEIVRPTGRMAARMLAKKNISEEEQEQSADNARERVKKILMAKSKSPQPNLSQDVEESDENDAPIVPRKRKIRISRNATPTSSPRNTSSSLFVSPTIRNSPSLRANASDSEDSPFNLATDDSRFQALVARKREEHRAKEAEENAEREKKIAERKKMAAVLDEDEDISDDIVERRLTQQQRPTRKASKRAVEEIQRETQRMSRNMQLTHKAVTKKQFKKAEFFAKFNFKVPGPEEDTLKSSQPPRPASSSSAPHSDIEMHETPPTSPASHGSDVEKPVITAPMLTSLGTADERHIDEALPLLEEVLASSSPARLEKGKGKAVEEAHPEPELPKIKYTLKQRPIRVRRSKIVNRMSSPLDDSDNDLEIINMKTPDAKMKKLDAIFDRVPAKQAKESHSLHALKMLAHLTSPGKQNLGRNKQPVITNSELQMSLQQKARQQASREREERLQILREKGVIIQTAEEREKEMAEVENLIAKARREGEEIMKREKAAAKKERKANGEADSLNDSDDEDWEEKENLTEVFSGSGSEDEGLASEGGSDASGEEEDDDDHEEELDEMALDESDRLGTTAMKSMFDNEADETDDDEAEANADLAVDGEMPDESDIDEMEEDDVLPANHTTRRSRKINVISDDEDEEIPSLETPVAHRVESPQQLHTYSPGAPNSVLRSATKTFIPGVTVAGPAGLGLTQIFAGTMDESQTEVSPTAIDASTSQLAAQNDSMAFFKGFSAPDLPPFIPTMPLMDEDSQEVVLDSQSAGNNVPESQPLESQTQAIQLGFSQSQIHGFDSLIDPLATQMSEYPDATQDVGFQHMTPIRGRFVDAPPSTVGTVVLGPGAVPEHPEETPVVKKKGKLRRRIQVAAFSDEDDTEEPAVETATQEDEFDISANAFDVMRNASKKKILVDEFDKKKSEAKAMVNEQAEESEDEYAGLGGASDDDSGDEEDEYVKEMIDDEGGKDVDERKLAAFFADRERASDEKQVEKLYNDISKGMLRRRRGADYDLSDSDDGGEARRRMKQKKFAKMQKALLADEKIGKIAENPKKLAFLRAIEDRGSEDEMDFLGDFAEQEDTTDSQSQSQAEESQQRVPDSQPDTIMGPPKRKRSDDAVEGEMRAPPNLRRTKPAKKPSNISEIRESLSSLIEEPNQIAVPTHSESDTEDELEIEGEPDLGSRKEKDKENRDPFALRRTNITTVDRIALKRASSSGLSANSRLAFATSSSAPGFKVPPLLRRATTNSSIASGSSSTNSSVSGGMSATERTAGGAGSEGIKRGGGKNSGVHFFARESERRAAVMKTEKRREKKRFKGAEVRRKVVGGLFGGGEFE